MKQTSIFAVIVLATFVFGYFNLTCEAAKLTTPEKLESARNIFLRLLAATEIPDDVRLSFVESRFIRGGVDGGCIKDKTNLKRRRINLSLSTAIIHKDCDASFPMTAALIAHEVGHIVYDRAITCGSTVNFQEAEFVMDKIGVELLNKLGFDGQSAMKQMLLAACKQVGGECVKGTPTHPSLYKRINAL